MRRATRTTALLVVAGLVVASCSGDDDADSPSTSTAPTPPASTTETTVGLATTTTARPSTTATSSVPATTEPLSDEEAVLAAYQAAYDAYWAASQDPDNPELRRRLNDLMDGDVLERSIQNLDEYVIAGRWVIPNPETPDEFVVRDVLVDGDRAVVELCLVNPWLLVEGDQDDPRIVDDAVYVTMRDEVLRFDGERWRQVDSLIVEDISEQGACDA